MLSILNRIFQPSKEKIVKKMLKKHNKIYHIGQVYFDSQPMIDGTIPKANEFNYLVANIKLYIFEKGREYKPFQLDLKLRNHAKVHIDSEGFFELEEAELIDENQEEIGKFNVEWENAIEILYPAIHKVIYISGACGVLEEYLTIKSKVSRISNKTYITNSINHSEELETEILEELKGVCKVTNDGYFLAISK